MARLLSKTINLLPGYQYQVLLYAMCCTNMVRIEHEHFDTEKYATYIGKLPNVSLIRLMAKMVQNVWLPLTRS